MEHSDNINVGGKDNSGYKISINLRYKVSM